VGTGPSDDDDLVAQLRKRRPGAFDATYQRYREPIWRFLDRLCGRRDLAEDLFQDTWLAAARNAHRLREGSQLLPWLYTIARNKHRNAVRFRFLDRKRREKVADEPIEGPPEPDAQAEARRRARQVELAFDTLPEVYREVLLLVLVEGLSTQAVAGVLALREDAVRKRLSRARAELARRLGLPNEGGTQS
jgi:RNA polymerase sigma-70 factor (ECF subfamily)